MSRAVRKGAERRGGIQRRVVEAVAAGAIATIPMTFAILAGRRAGLIATPSPKQVTQEVAEKVAPLPEQGEPGFQPMWILGHFAYGGVCGLIYAQLRRFLPERTPVAGMLFGTGVWVVSYGGYLPALHLYPTPEKDSNSRVGVMIAAHLVYGASLAEIHSRMNQHR